MGGTAGIWVRHNSRQLETRERVVLYTAALSCLDETGTVKDYSMMRLADECGLSLRGTQAALRILSRLGLLVQGDDCFRLSKYILERLGGKICREPELPDTPVDTSIDTTVGGKICRAQEEGFHLIPSDSMDSLSPVTSSVPQDPAATIQPDYQARVLEEFRKLPGTTGHVSDADRREAASLEAAGFAAETVEAALVVGMSRHISAGGPVEPARVQSLRFFRGVVEELYARPPTPGQVKHLREQLPRLLERKREFYRGLVKGGVP